MIDLRRDGRERRPGRGSEDDGYPGGGGGGGLVVLQGRTISCAAMAQAGLGGPGGGLWTGATPTSASAEGYVGQVLVLPNGLGAPAGPRITSPLDRETVTTNRPDVVGTATPDTDVRLYVDGSAGSGTAPPRSFGSHPRLPCPLVCGAWRSRPRSPGSRAQPAKQLRLRCWANPAPECSMVATSRPAPPGFSQPSTTASCGVPYRYSGDRLPQMAGAAPITFAIEPEADTALPARLKVNSQTGEFDWVPQQGEAGRYAMRLYARSPLGEATQSFTVTVECPARQEREVACGCGATPWVPLGALALVALCFRRRSRPLMAP